MSSTEVRLVLPLPGAAWARDMDLGIAPFQGLGIRIDAYDILNVVAVRVADADERVTCIVGLEDAEGEITEARAESFGFAPCGEPFAGPAVADADSKRALSAMLITFAAGRMWGKQTSLPFAPFAGLQIDVGARVLTVFSVVVKDRYRHSDVTCLASFGDEDAAQLTEDDCVALGFEECVYP